MMPDGLSTSLRRVRDTLDIVARVRICVRSTPPFHLTHLIHLIGKPRSNVDSFCGGFPINESRESSETADVALRARFFLLMDVIPVEKANG